MNANFFWCRFSDKNICRNSLIVNKVFLLCVFDYALGLLQRRAQLDEQISGGAWVFVHNWATGFIQVYTHWVMLLRWTNLFDTSLWTGAVVVVWRRQVYKIRLGVASKRNDAPPMVKVRVFRIVLEWGSFCVEKPTHAIHFLNANVRHTVSVMSLCITLMNIFVPSL